METVLVRDGVGFIFSVVTSMGLCFRLKPNQCQKHRDILITAEWGSHGIKAISAPHLTPPASRLGMHNNLGGDTTWTGDPH